MSAQEAGWQFKSEEEDYSSQAPATQSMSAVNWTASEYVAHEKGAGWYMLVVASSLVIAAVVYLITREMVSPVVVGILGISFAAFGARKPQVLDYSIDNSGIQVGAKHYPYGMFRTFSVLQEGGVRSILLMPLQRFSQPLSIYYEPTDEERILDALGAHLPHEDRKIGPVENLARKIRF